MKKAPLQRGLSIRNRTITNRNGTNPMISGTTPLERPSWAVDTSMDGDIVLHRGMLYEHAGMTAQILDDIPAGEQPRPDVAINFQNYGTEEQLYVPVSRLDDLIALLGRVRCSIIIRPNTGEVVAVAPGRLRP